MLTELATMNSTPRSEREERAGLVCSQLYEFTYYTRTDSRERMKLSVKLTSYQRQHTLLT